MKLKGVDLKATVQDNMKANHGTALRTQLPSLIAQAMNAPTVRLYCDKHHADAEYFSALSK